MKDCCLGEARRHLKKHRDVARCDACGALLLAYGNQRDFNATVDELEKRGVPYATAEMGRLHVVAKQA